MKSHVSAERYGVRICFLILIGMTACAPKLLLPTAVVEPEQIKKGIDIEKALDAHASTPPPVGQAWYEVLPGTIPVLVTAPHATKIMKDGKYRMSDGGGTGALAVLLHDATGAFAIHTTYQGPSDPNYYDDNDFKRAVSSVLSTNRIALVLDLHASDAYRPYDVDLGTMDGASLVGKDHLTKLLAVSLQREGLINISANRFSAAKNQTITKWVAAMGVPCIQLELSSTWTVPHEGTLEAHRFAQLLEALIRFIWQVAPKPAG